MGEALDFIIIFSGVFTIAMIYFIIINPSILNLKCLLVGGLTVYIAVKIEESNNNKPKGNV